MASETTFQPVSPHASEYTKPLAYLSLSRDFDEFSICEQFHQELWRSIIIKTWKLSTFEYGDWRSSVNRIPRLRETDTIQHLSPSRYRVNTKRITRCSFPFHSLTASEKCLISLPSYPEIQIWIVRKAWWNLQTRSRASQLIRNYAHGGSNTRVQMNNERKLSTKIWGKYPLMRLIVVKRSIHVLISTKEKPRWEDLDDDCEKIRVIVFSLRW